MISINVVGPAAGKRAGTGMMRSSWSVPRLDPPTAVLLSAAALPESEGFYSLNLGTITQGKDTFGVLRDREVTHFNVSGDLVIQSRLPQATVPFRKLLHWGEVYSDTFTVHYAGRTIQGWMERVVSVSFDWIFDGNFLINKETVTVISQTCNGVPYLPAQVGSIWCALSGIERQAGTNYLMGYTTSTFSRLPTQAEEVAYMNVMKNHTRAPFGRIDVYSLTFIPTAYSVEEMITLVSNSLKAFRWNGQLVGQEPIDYGELTSECADQLDYVDSNVLSLVFDVNDWRNLHSMWTMIANARGWAKVRAVLKTIRIGHFDRLIRSDFLALFKPGASLYLYEKYGVETALSDLNRIRQGMCKFIARGLSVRLHSRRIVPLPVTTEKYRTFTATMTVEVGSYPDGVLGKLQELIGSLKKFGVYPAMTNVHDLIPFSFVVDWFIDFGKFVKGCDAWLDVKNYFPVYYCMMSSKWVAGYDSALIVPACVPVSGDVEIISYLRWITKEVPLPPLSLPGLGSGPLSHGAESLALILQRAK